MASNDKTPALNIDSLIDKNNPEEVKLFIQRQSILDTPDFISLKNTLRRICMMYKEFKPLTPEVLNQEYKKLEEANFQGIPYKKAMFGDLVTFLRYLPYHVEFCGEPSLHCEIKAVVPRHLQHLADFFQQDRANRIPGYNVNGRRIFYLPYDDQWEIVEYVLRRPLGVPYEEIEEIFMRKFCLHEKFEMTSCEHLLHFLKHTDLFGRKGMVFHQIYFDRDRSKHLYLKDGKLDEEVVNCLKQNGEDVEAYQVETPEVTNHSSTVDSQ